MRFLRSLWLLGILAGVFVGTSVHAEDVTLAWDPNTEPDLDGYTVYYSQGTPGPPYDYVGDLPLSALPDPDNPQITLTDLENQVNYYFALTAYDVNGNESSFSSSLCIYIGETIQECPAATVVSTPVSGDSGGASGGGGCFIGAAGPGASISGALLKSVIGWRAMAILVIILSSVMALKSGRVGSISKDGVLGDF